MTHASDAAGVAAARAACLVALAIVGAVLALLVTGSANLGALAAAAFAVAAIARATVALPHGDSAVFVLLWAGLGATLGMAFVAAFSVGPVCLVAVLMLGLAIAAAPNQTGRSRAAPRYVAVQAAALVAAIALTLIAS